MEGRPNHGRDLDRHNFREMLEDCVRLSREVQLSGKQGYFSFRSAGIWSLVVAIVLVVPFYALSIQEFWHAAPGTGGAGLVEGPNETPEQKLDTVLRTLIVMPINLAVVALVVFVFLVPLSVLGQIIRRHLPGRD